MLGLYSTATLNPKPPTCVRFCSNNDLSAFRVSDFRDGFAVLGGRLGVFRGLESSSWELGFKVRGFGAFRGLGFGNLRGVGKIGELKK